MAMVWLSFVSETEKPYRTLRCQCYFFFKKIYIEIANECKLCLKYRYHCFNSEWGLRLSYFIVFREIMFSNKRFSFLLLRRVHSFDSLLLLLYILLRIDYSNYLFIDIKRCFGFFFAIYASFLLLKSFACEIRSLTILPKIVKGEHDGKRFTMYFFGDQTIFMFFVFFRGISCKTTFNVVIKKMIALQGWWEKLIYYT